MAYIKNLSPNRWFVQASLGTGEQRRKRAAYVDGTRRDAVAKGVALETALAHEQEQANVDEEVGPLVREYLASWLRDYAATKKPATQSQYRIAVEKATPRLGALRLRDVTAGDLLALEAWLRTNGKVQRRVAYPGAGLSTSTVAFYRAVLVKAFKMAPARWRPEAALRDLPPLQIVPVKAQVRLNEGQARRLLDTLDAPCWAEWRDLWLVGLCCGLRMGELRGLRWQDVDLSGRLLHVRQQITRVRGRDSLGSPKSGKPRDVPLPDLALDALAARWQQRRAHAPDDSATLVFGQGDGRPFSDGRARRAFAQIVTEAGLPPCAPHALRHSFVTLALAAGTPLAYVSWIVGHVSSDFTRSVYGEPATGAMREAADLFSAHLAKNAHRNAH